LRGLTSVVKELFK